MRRSFRRGLALGLLGGAALTVLRMTQARRGAPAGAPAMPPPDWPPMPGTTPVTVPEPEIDVHVAPGPEPEPTPRPRPAKKATRKKLEPPPPWVEPVEGSCPESHPVKAKLASNIFHVPGGFNYPRTRPDRCYIDTAAAEADGLRASKR